MDLRKETIKQKAANLCRMPSNLLASVDVIGFQATDAYSSLDPTNAIYNMCIYSRDEKVNVMLRTRRESLISREIYGRHGYETEVWNQETFLGP
jgi:hypothetical protein